MGSYTLSWRESTTVPLVELCRRLMERGAPIKLNPQCSTLGISEIDFEIIGFLQKSVDDKTLETTYKW
jgi:hypothetical protein